MQTYSDEYIEYWADIYLETDSVRNNLRFDAFIEHPETIMESIGTADKLQASLDEIEMLLPEYVEGYMDDTEVLQEELDRRFERQGHIVEMHGNKNIEKFHNHDCPKKWKTNTCKKYRGAL